MADQLALFGDPPAPKMHRGAVFSDCGRYRYQLTRVWDAALPRVAFLLLNPSKAGDERDDGTSTKCVGFAQRFNVEGQRYGGCDLVNLYGWIDTEPRALFEARRSGIDVVGPANVAYVEQVLARAALRVVAWGGNADGFSPIEKFAFLRRFAPLYSLGRNEDGSPTHPGRIAYETPLERYLTV